MEQGFTIDAPPCPSGRGSVVIELSIGGNLSAALSKDRDAMELRNGSGAVTLRYTDLFVHDAEGRALPAQLDVSGQTLSIRVDAFDVTYPLSVDPLITHEQTKLVASDGAPNDTFGLAVAVSGDTAVVGAPDNTNGNGQLAGAAYVFVQSGATWSQQAKLNTATLILP